MSVGAQWASIIAYTDALHGGGKMQMGTLNGDGFALIPTGSDVQNATPEQALNAALQLVPDAVQRWDFTTTPPTIHFYQRAAAPTHDLHLTDGVQVEQQLQSREDLAARGVRIVYQYEINGEPMVSVDAAGESSGVNVLIANVDLNGGGGGGTGASAGMGGGGGSSEPIGVPLVKEEHEIVSEAIDYTSPEWWFKNVETGAATAGDIAVGIGTHMALDANAPENAGFANLGGCNLHLRTPLAGWQNKSHARRAIVRGYLSVNVTYEAGDITLTGVDKVMAYVKLAVTDLPSDIYDHVLQNEGSAGGSGGGPEPGIGGDQVFLPSGIAAQLLAALGEVHHEGALRFEDDECMMTVETGDCINLDDKPSHEDMRAQVQEVEHIIATGETTVTVGPPQHLGIQEFMQTVRILRVSVPTNLDMRATGGAGGGGGGWGGGGFSPMTMKGPTGNVSVEVSAAAKLYDHEVTGGEWDNKFEIKGSTGEVKSEDGDGNKMTASATGYRIENEEGDYVLLDIHGLHIVMADGRETHYKLNELSMDDDEGKRVRMTNETLRYVDEEKETQVQADGVTTEDGDAKAEVKPGRVHIEDGSGSVSIEPIEDKEATMTEIEVCGDDGEDAKRYILTTPEEPA